jgi:thioredoxin-like negative regulator of GroEL
MLTSTTDRLPTVDDATALSGLVDDSARPTLILFAADALGQARRLEERLLRLAPEGRVNLARVDADARPELAQLAGVAGLPALVLFRSGQAAARRLGEIDDDALRDWLDDELAA